MSKTELAQVIQAVREANEKAAMQSEAHHDAHCKVRWRRRLLVVLCVAGVAYVAGEYFHFEFLFKGWEFLAASLCDKAIFGMGS